MMTGRGEDGEGGQGQVVGQVPADSTVVPL